MTKSEWQYLYKKCPIFSYERILVNTRFGAMLVFCNLLSSAQILIGVIFCREDSRAVARLFRARPTSLTFLSPKMEDFAEYTSHDAESMSRLGEAIDVYCRAFSTAALRTTLSQSLKESADYIVERICRMGYAMGCRVVCRSVREMVPYVSDFDSEIFVVMAAFLMVMAVEQGQDVEVLIGDGDGRIFPIFHIPVIREQEFFSDNQCVHEALLLCQSLSEKKRILFECSLRKSEGQRYVSAAFLPQTKQLDYLGLKKPLKALDYSDGTSG